jgi:hypothetical protein
VNSEDVKEPIRVSLTIWPHTRNQLNIVKAHMSEGRAKVVPLDEVILSLIDHYNAAPPQSVGSKVKEYA